MSAVPTPFVPGYDYSDHSTSQPRTPQPGINLDTDFNAVKVACDTLASRLAEIQRDDGALRNGTVGVDQLTTAALLVFQSQLILADFTAFTPLIEAFLSDYLSAYAAQGVTADFLRWTCNGNGVQTVFSIPGALINSVRSYLVVEGGLVVDPDTYYTIDKVADTITFIGGMIPQTGQPVTVISLGYPRLMAEFEPIGTVDIQDGAVTAAKLASSAVTTVKILDANVTTAKLAALSVTNAKVADATLTASKFAVGELIPFVPAAGSIVQTVRTAITDAGGIYFTGGSIIPHDTTMPQITEGVSLITTAAITPRNNPATWRVRARMNVQSASAGVMAAMSMFKDSVAAAIAADSVYGPTANKRIVVELEATFTTASLTPFTIKTRFGAASAAHNIILPNLTTYPFGVSEEGASIEVFEIKQ